MQCRQCNGEFEAKRSTAKYCSANCRKLAFLMDGKVSVPENSENAKISLEQCRYCGEPLSGLQMPRQHVGACLDCSITRGKPKRPLHYSSEFTGQMTAYEREHYKPAAKLGPGQYNRVSKPGDEHYSVASSVPHVPQGGRTARKVV